MILMEHGIVVYRSKDSTEYSRKTDTDNFWETRDGATDHVGGSVRIQH